MIILRYKSIKWLDKIVNHHRWSPVSCEESWLWQHVGLEPRPLDLEVDTLTTRPLLCLIVLIKHWTGRHQLSKMGFWRFPINNLKMKIIYQNEDEKYTSAVVQLKYGNKLNTATPEVVPSIFDFTVEIRNIIIHTKYYGVRAIATHKHVQTMKTRNYDDDKSKVRWWKVDSAMVKSRNNDTTMVITRYNFVFSPSYFRTFTIVVSFVFVISTFHHRTIAFSPS